MSYTERIQLEADGSKLFRALNKAQQQIDKLSRSITLRFNPSRTLDAVEQRLNRLGRQVLRPRVELNLRAADRQLRELQQTRIARVRVQYEAGALPAAAAAPGGSACHQWPLPWRLVS